MTDAEILRRYSALLADYDVNISMELKRIADKLESKPERVSAEEVFNKFYTDTDVSFTGYAHIHKHTILAMMKEYASQSLILPSDEDINKAVDKEVPYTMITPEEYTNGERVGFRFGAKWAISDILKKNG